MVRYRDTVTGPHLGSSGWVYGAPLLCCAVVGGVWRMACAALCGELCACARPGGERPGPRGSVVARHACFLRCGAETAETEERVESAAVEPPPT